MRKAVEFPDPKRGQPTLTGRDAGKVFIITEMSAWDAEAWGQRAFGCMVRAGLKAPTTEVVSGMAAVAAYGISAFLSAPWADVQPLLAEMMDKCVKIKEEAIPLGRTLTRDDVEEVVTLLQLREEAVRLHTDFSLAAGALAAVVQATTWFEASSPIPTSPSISARSSRAEKLRSLIYNQSIRPRTRGSWSKSSRSMRGTAG